MFSPRILVVSFGAVLLVLYSRIITFVPDGITYGVIEAARNLAQGYGLVTNAAPAAFIPYYTNPTPPFPFLWYPLVPLVTSALFRVFGLHPNLVVVFPMAMYLVSGIAVFELGRRLFSVTTGLLASLVVLSQPFMIETAARENFSDPVLVALVVSVVWALVRGTDELTQRPMAWVIGGGALMGLCQYARSAATVLYLPMIVLVGLAARRQRLRHVGLFLLACFVVQCPLFLWNLRHIGRLTFTPGYVFLFQTPSFPAQAALVSVLPPDFPIVQQYGREVFLKWLSQLWVHYKYFFTMTNPLVMVGALLYGFGSVTPRQRILWVFAIILYVTIATLNSLFIWDNRYLLPVVPFVAILGVECIRATLQKAPLGLLVRTGAAIVLGFLVLAESGDFFYQSVKSRDQFPAILREQSERAAFIKANLREGDVVLSVDAPLIAWETGNVALGLPLNPVKGMLLRDHYVRFNTIMLETRRPRSDIFGFAEDWFQIARGEKTFLDFQPERFATLSTGQRLVLLRSKTR